MFCCPFLRSVTIFSTFSTTSQKRMSPLQLPMYCWKNCGLHIGTGIGRLAICVCDCGWLSRRLCIWAYSLIFSFVLIVCRMFDYRKHCIDLHLASNFSHIHSIVCSRFIYPFTGRIGLFIAYGVVLACAITLILNYEYLSSTKRSNHIISGISK